MVSRCVISPSRPGAPPMWRCGWWRICCPTRCWSCMSPRRADAVGRSLSTSGWSKSDERLREEAKALMAQKLVVVGNGMAGVRAIEEILLRSGPATGSETFDIPVFGDEPYGNYNRIVLSNVLAGSQDIEADEGDIFLNGLDWYNENNIDLRAGVRVVRIDRFARLVHADDGSVPRYDSLTLATGSRSFFPPMAGLWADDKTLADGVFGFRTLDDCIGMISQAAHRTKAVVIGGGLLGLEAARGLQNRGLAVDIVHAGATLMNAQLDDVAGAILRKSVQHIGIAVHLEKPPTDGRERQAVGNRVLRRRFGRLRHAGGRGGHPAQRRPRAARRPDRRAGDRRR